MDETSVSAQHYERQAHKPIKYKCPINHVTKFSLELKYEILSEPLKHQNLTCKLSFTSLSNTRGDTLGREPTASDINLPILLSGATRPSCDEKLFNTIS